VQTTGSLALRATVRERAFSSDPANSQLIRCFSAAPSKTNIPQLRIAFRQSLLDGERELVTSCCSAKVLVAQKRASEFSVLPSLVFLTSNSMMA